MINFAILKLLSIFGVATCPNEHSFFFFPPWYEYLNRGLDPYGQCVVQPDQTNFPQDILPIGLALVDMLIRLAGFVAVLAIMYAGISYMVAMGNSENAAKARKRLYYALISLGIVFAAAATVQFVGKVLVK